MFLNRKLWLAVYEGAGDGNLPPPPPKVDPPAGKTFTQDEVNKLLADNKRQLQRTNTELVTQLEQMKQNTNLTQQERDELATRIETLQQQYMSKEELARQELANKEKKFKTDFDNVSKQAQDWQGRYSDLFKTQIITQAASENNAFSVQQMVEYLAPRTEIVPQLGEDGKPTGHFVAVLPMQIEKDGKVENVKMAVPDAIKTMKGMPQKFGNFFKGEGTPGLGLSTTGTTANDGKIEFTPNMSDADYTKWRKQQGLTQ